MSNTEGNSVAVVKLAIGTATDRLKPLIDENDRTPITDGHIDIYAAVTGPKEKRSQQSNNAWTSRVSVQVRGRAHQTLKRGEQPFPLEKGVLENYRTLGGVLFFHVVWANGKHQIRYAPLTPYKINDLIEKHTGGGKIKVPTKPFPAEADEMIRVVNFSAKAQAQAHAIDYNSVAFGEIRSFHIDSDRPLDLSVPVAFDAPDQNISIVITTDRGITLPANLRGTLTPVAYIGEEWDIVVKSGDVVFHRPIRKQVDRTTVALHLSEGMYVTLTQEGEQLKGEFTLASQSNLVARLKDLEFSRAVAATGGFTLGAQDVRLDEASELELVTREEYATLTRLQDTLEALGAQASLIDIDRVTAAEVQAFDYLHRVLFENEPLTDPFRQMGRVRQRIGGWALELMVVPGSEGRDWDVVGLKTAGERFAFAQNDGKDGEKVLVTPYELLDREAAERSINLQLDSAPEAYEKIATFDHTRGLAVMAALKIIGAADAVPERRDELLGAAESLMNWVLEQAPNDPAGIVNRMQIKARREPLADADRTLLRKLRGEPAYEDGIDAVALRACCSVLLGEVEEYDYWASLMDDEQRESFRGWPIVHLLPGSDEAVQLASPPAE